MNKSIVLGRIGFQDAKERDCGLSYEESEARRNVVEDFSKRASMEETSQMQKSRELWLKEDDKNSKVLSQDG